MDCLEHVGMCAPFLFHFHKGRTDSHNTRCDPSAFELGQILHWVLVDRKIWSKQCDSYDI